MIEHVFSAYRAVRSFNQPPNNAAAMKDMRTRHSRYTRPRGKILQTDGTALIGRTQRYLFQTGSGVIKETICRHDIQFQRNQPELVPSPSACGTIKFFWPNRTNSVNYVKH
jgi:hypothetical protein